jgi:hypothetical protein
MGFEVFTAVRVQIVVFWVVKSCSLLGGYYLFRGTHSSTLRTVFYMFFYYMPLARVRVNEKLGLCLTRTLAQTFIKLPRLVSNYRPVTFVIEVLLFSFYQYTRQLKFCFECEKYVDILRKGIS